MSSDLSDWYGGTMNYSYAELAKIKRSVHCMPNIKKFIIGKELVKIYCKEVKKSRRSLYPMEDWLKVMYNRYS